MSDVPSPGPKEPLFTLETAAALLGISAVLGVQFAWVKPSNFGGFDEWLILSLVSRGIVDVPYANRPFELLWTLPAALGPPSLWTYYALHTTYLAALGGLVFLLCRRLLPGEPLVPLLAGVFAAAWAPQDHARLNVVLGYPGLTFGAYLAVTLLVESWFRQRFVLLMLGALVAFLNIRGYEASGPLLLGAPLLLTGVKKPARLLTWVAAWAAAVLLALVLVALPLLVPGRGLAYQQQILGGLDLHPIRVLGRLAELYRYHLLPLATTPLAELAVAAVPLAAAAFLASFALTASAAGARTGAFVAGRWDRLRVMLVGIVLAGLGYSLLALNAGPVVAARTQFLSAPGIGLFLAASSALLASFVPRRWRLLFLALLGTWVVTVGTARTVALQRFWDRVSVHADQDRLLRQLVEQAQHLEPNTFVILLDEARVFETSAGFRHALEYLYPGEAIGCVWRKWDVLYPARFTADGILSEPWPEIRIPWLAPVTRHRHDELIVLHQPAAGALRILAQWPEGVLPPLPKGASYAPRARIRQGTPPRTRAILSRASQDSPWIPGDRIRPWSTP